MTVFLAMVLTMSVMGLIVLPGRRRSISPAGRGGPMDEDRFRSTVEEVLDRQFCPYCGAHRFRSASGVCEQCGGGLVDPGGGAPGVTP